MRSFLSQHYMVVESERNYSHVRNYAIVKALCYDAGSFTCFPLDRMIRCMMTRRHK